MPLQAISISWSVFKFGITKPHEYNENRNISGAELTPSLSFLFLVFFFYFYGLMYKDCGKRKMQPDLFKNFLN